MKHIIFGGDGFLGTELSRKLIGKGERVLVCDRKQSRDSGIYDDGSLLEYIRLDVTRREEFARLEIEPGDVVYHFAARLLVPIVPRTQRKELFWTSLYVGTQNILTFMEEKGLNNLVYYTTDMVYGHTLHHPRFEDHLRNPLGPYGEAKYQTELLCEDYRMKGFNITLFRPRMIIGPGRLGILEKLFKLIDHNLPVPMIGNGTNYFQFVSVNDCARACLLAVAAGFPNENYNLGSINPPTVGELLKKLIAEANSKSFLLATPVRLVKFTLAVLDRIGLAIMDPEQYLIADETCVLDVSRASRDLGWEPRDNDIDMLFTAYNHYHKL
jgi:dTDP-glucose 4,6-dehydratase